ncbi:type II/IV secretion system protein [Patescibacteria group bacterium]|nr:MAG: type II/IV secretion system protein [Patescibacteria group bacterium]
MVDLNDSDTRVEELQRKEEEELASILAKKYEVGYQDLTRTSINTDALRVIEESAARESESAAFDLVGKKLSVAVRSPQHPKLPPVLSSLEKEGYTIQLYMVSRTSLGRAWEHYKDLSFATESKQGVFDISSDELKKWVETIHTVDDIQKAVSDVVEMKKAYRISKILEVVLAGAIAVDASDIHIEPSSENVRMRYRLDGVLHNAVNFDLETSHLLLSRLKLLSGLKLNLKDRPQDGRFSIALNGKDTEVRTSVIPGAYGETVVMRLLNPDTISVPFEALGMEPKLRTLVEKEIQNPNGMLLNTGPTGSGKTTTLYACMKKINSPEIKIITIEDPIEYHVDGLVQTQVDQKNYTFLQGLRAALRQDPDAIMIGEIRDNEVAQTAIDAALTGHFVFSTLHTNNAAGTFPRLVDLGVDPKVFGSSINVAMAQRLVRVLCKACKKAVPLEGVTKDRVEKVLAGLRDKSVIPADRTNIFEPVGCLECNHTGFKGRIGIFEAIIIDSEMDTLLRTSPSEHDIQTLQHTKEILTMIEDGVMKVVSGITSLTELERVVLIENALS